MDGRKFTTKLISDTKSQNKIHYYIMNELEDIIDLTIIEDDLIEVMKDNNKQYLILINLKENDTSSESDSEIEIIWRANFLMKQLLFIKTNVGNILNSGKLND